MSEQKRLVGNVTKNTVNTRAGNTYGADPIKLLGGMLSLGLDCDDDNTIAYLDSNNLEDTNKYKTQLKKQEAQLKKEQKAIKKQQQEIKKLKEALKPQKTSLTKINVKTQNPIKLTPNKNTDEELFKLRKKNNNEAMQRRADILYGSDEEYNNKYNLKQKEEETLNTKSNFKEQPIIEYEAQTQLQPEISNSEKMFYNNGTLADMPLGTSLKNNNGEVDLTNIDIQKTDLPKTTFDLIVSKNSFKNGFALTKEEKEMINHLNEQEVDINGLGKITVGELIPNLEECVQEQKKIYYYLPKSAPFVVEETIQNQYLNDLNLLIKVIQGYITVLASMQNPMPSVDEIKQMLKQEGWSEVVRTTNMKIGTNFSNAISISYFCEVNDLTDLEEMLLSYVNGSIIGATFLGLFLPDTAGLLKLNKADSDLNTNYTKDAKIYNSIDELPMKFREFVKNKAKGENLKSIFFNSNSGLSQRISDSEVMLDLVTNEEKIEKILKNNGNTSIIFNTNKNLYYAIKKTDICNLKRDEEGNISGDLIDISDYGNEKDNLIQAAKRLQDFGEFAPRVIIVHFVISKKSQNYHKQWLKIKKEFYNAIKKYKKHTK